MKLYQILFYLLFLSNILIVSCQNSNHQEAIAVKGDYQLTEVHLKKHISDLENILGTLSQEEVESEKNVLVQMFMDAPEETLASLKEKTSSLLDLRKNQKAPPYSISPGNQKVRDVLGTDIGQMNFNSKKASDFRAFLGNSLLQSKSNSYNSGYNSSHFSSSNAKIQFCANGTFVQALSGYLSIDVEGMSGHTGNDTDYMPGYWEVASLPNGMLIILFYSTHPSMLEDSPNGFLPFPVAKYTNDFVSMPNGDGYSRVAHSYCN